MTDLEILNENDLSKKVYMVFEKYKPLIMKKACLYEKCSRGRIDREDFALDVYEKLYYFVGRIVIEKVKNFDNFSYYQSVRFAIFRVYHKTRKIFEQEKLFDLDSEGNEINMAISKFGVSELSPDIPKFFSYLTERQKYVLKQYMNGKTYLQIRSVLKCSHGTIAGEMRKMRKIYNEFF